MSWIFKGVWLYIYPLVTRLLYSLIDFLPARTRIARWKNVRRGLMNSEPQPSQDQYYILFFCPSLGEYESIVTLIEHIRTIRTNSFIEISFFSESGYNPIKSDYQHKADHISYYPADTHQSVYQFFNNRNPELCIISSLAIWPIFLRELIRQEIPFYFIAVHVKSGFTKNIYYRSLTSYLKESHGIICVDHTSILKLLKLGIGSNLHLGGDPRIESISNQIKKNSNGISSLNDIFLNRKVIVFGSIHPEDENIIFPCLSKLTNQNWTIVLAPHDPIRSKTMLLSFNNAVLLSKFENNMKPKIIIIDTIGVLKFCYSFSKISYIGGGFNPGIHNILEPLLAQSAVIIGPNYKNSYIAEELIQKKSIMSISSSEELESAINEFSDHQIRKTKIGISNNIISNYSGATNRIMNIIFSNS